MAKMKASERRDYNLSKTDVITYKKSREPRQKNYMILRGTGLNVQESLEENEKMKTLAKRRRFKLKFMHANTLEELIAHFKDANTWATAVIYHRGSIEDQNDELKKTLKRLLIPTLEVSEEGKTADFFDGLQSLCK